VLATTMMAKMRASALPPASQPAAVVVARPNVAERPANHRGHLANVRSATRRRPPWQVSDPTMAAWRASRGSAPTVNSSAQPSRVGKEQSIPLQNRVTPFGDIVAIPERGTLLGNRGILHDDQKRIVRTAQVRRWLTCVLEFKGIRRTIMKPHRYTELFFLDEVTALAAGHRPCCECRRQAYQAFQSYWRDAVSAQARADEMDRGLQTDRRVRGGGKGTFQAPCEDLPTGTFVEQGAAAWLLRGDQLLRWTPGGYAEHRIRPNGLVTVLTPRSTVAVLRAGYVPSVHPSADV